MTQWIISTDPLGSLETAIELSICLVGTNV
jgi:hypothetical protein